MMSSMNRLEQDVTSRFKIENIDHVTSNQISFDVATHDVHHMLSHLKTAGWRQLSLLTCVDWIDEGVFQLVFVLFNWDEPIHIQVRTKIDRNHPVFQTITTIYPGARYYEREVYEFFGIDFEGNEDCKRQLFLENWDDMPPLRKDFDPQAYSDRKYMKRDYPTNYNTGEGNE